MTTTNDAEQQSTGRDPWVLVLAAVLGAVAWILIGVAAGAALSPSGDGSSPTPTSEPGPAVVTR